MSLIRNDLSVFGTLFSKVWRRRQAEMQGVLGRRARAHGDVCHSKCQCHYFKRKDSRLRSYSSHPLHRTFKQNWSSFAQFFYPTSLITFSDLLFELVGDRLASLLAAMVCHAVPLHSMAGLWSRGYDILLQFNQPSLEVHSKESGNQKLRSTYCSLQVQCIFIIKMVLYFLRETVVSILLSYKLSLRS